MHLIAMLCRSLETPTVILLCPEQQVHGVLPHSGVDDPGGVCEVGGWRSVFSLSHILSNPFGIICMRFKTGFGHLRESLGLLWSQL